MPGCWGDVGGGGSGDHDVVGFLGVAAVVGLQPGGDGRYVEGVGAGDEALQAGDPNGVGDVGIGHGGLGADVEYPVAGVAHDGLVDGADDLLDSAGEAVGTGDGVRPADGGQFLEVVGCLGVWGRDVDGVGVRGRRVGVVCGGGVDAEVVLGDDASAVQALDVGLVAVPDLPE